MSEIIQDKDSADKIELLLKEWGVKCLVNTEVEKGGYDEYRGIFSGLNLDGTSHDSPESYLTYKLEEYLSNSDTRKYNTDNFKLKELLYRLGFIKIFGGVLSLDIEDLELIERIRVFSEHRGNSNE